ERESIFQKGLRRHGRLYCGRFPECVIVTATSGKYADCFGFTEEEVFAALRAKGIPEERIRAYGFAFCGKKVLINGKKADLE
ncbi:MAG: hypothetical protein K2P41_16470, partial [Lachnospiraceae bacterium]|nr:hypothetical protein [Lachnospiraceae bacterium]